MLSSVRRPAWGASKSKFLVSVAATVMLAACSAESDRFADNPSDSDPVYTASVPKQQSVQAQAPDSDVVTSRPLTNASVKPPRYDYSKSYSAPQYKQPAYAKAPAVSAPQVETVDAPQVAAGSAVTVGPGMTLYSIARANNLSVSQLAAANNIKAPYSVHTGQRIMIPGASSPSLPETAAVTPRAAAPKLVAESVPAKPFKTGPSVSGKISGAGHTVGNGETLFSLGRKYNVSPYAIADANGLPHNAQLTLGQSVRIPGGKAAGTPVAARPATQVPAKIQTAKAETAVPEATDTETVPAPKQQATTEPGQTPTTEQPAQTTEQQVTEQTPVEGGSSGMRWPVRGKVISGFGPKSNGLKNEGINIAVPEGTSVRAADSGVVAYAGNELKGYGNLVLIRHEDGYVTAYAHAKELFVKRGDTVKRGDVIAKAGQTGSVSSPQLHFEVRKGATALDPMKFLNASTASN
jgi:murein DD-endopeptidase MepM/ murein hydrolase activator NlpD